jgi:hypothetical protein
MNRRRMVLVLAAVLVLASLGWLLPLSKTSQAAPVPSGDAAFKGKVLLVHTNNMMSVFLLEKAQVQRIGDHSWLMGKGVAEGRMGDWYKGRTVRLRMEHIVSITEFDELKDAKKALESGGGMPFGGGYAVPVGEAVPATSSAPSAPPAPAPAGK